MIINSVTLEFRKVVKRESHIIGGPEIMTRRIRFKHPECVEDTVTVKVKRGQTKRQLEKGRDYTIDHRDYALVIPPEFDLLDGDTFILSYEYVVASADLSTDGNIFVNGRWKEEILGSMTTQSGEIINWSGGWRFYLTIGIRKDKLHAWDLKELAQKLSTWLNDDKRIYCVFPGSDEGCYLVPNIEIRQYSTELELFNFKSKHRFKKILGIKTQ